MNVPRSITSVFLLASLAVAFLLTAVSASAQHLEGHEALGSGGLVYNTPIAGPGTDYAWDIAVDAQGNAYIAGMSDSDSLEAAANTHRFGGGGDFDAVVVKLDQSGGVVYVAWIGGSALDQASRVAVGADGSVYVAGYTYSADFPVTAGAYDGTFNGGDIDAFVAKLSPDGSQLAYATFLGGASDDFGGGIAVDVEGRAFVTGYTESADFPTTPDAYDPTHNGSSDVIAVRLNAAGSALAYSSFVGSGGGEIGYDVAIGPAGEVYLTGQTNSPGFPTTPGVVGPLYGGGTGDAFVLSLSPTGGLAYSTFLGGDQFDDAKGIDVDAQGNAFVAGRTESFNFPTTPGAYDETYNGGRDVFVTRLSANGAAYGYSTFVGGGGEDESGSIALSPAGAALVGGWTFSPDFPVTPGAIDPTYDNDYDAFVLALNDSGSSLGYSTFLGGPSADYARGIGTDGDSTAYVAGYTGFENVDAFGMKLSWSATPTSINEAPVTMRLTARPNPMSSRAVLEFTLPAPTLVRVAVFDALGREVAVLVDRELGAGAHETVFDARGLSAGTYVYRLVAGSVAQTGRLMLTR